MVQSSQSFTLSAADHSSEAPDRRCSSLITCVGVSHCDPSGRLSQRRRYHPIATPGSRACRYKTASGRGKWLNRDPIGELGGLNLYGLLLNEPISKIDPFGLSDQCQQLVEDLLAAYAEHRGREEFGDFLYDRAHDFNMRDGTGFKDHLVAGGQSGSVGRHIAAGAGLTVSSRHFAGPIATRAESFYDIAIQGVFSAKTMKEAKAEAADNKASRQVGKAFLDHLRGKYGFKDDCASLDILREKLYDILCK